MQPLQGNLLNLLGEEEGARGRGRGSPSMTPAACVSRAPGMPKKLNTLYVVRWPKRALTICMLRKSFEILPGLPSRSQNVQEYISMLPQRLQSSTKRLLIQRELPRANPEPYDSIGFEAKGVAFVRQGRSSANGSGLGVLFTLKYN